MMESCVKNWQDVCMHNIGEYFTFKEISGGVSSKAFQFIYAVSEPDEKKERGLSPMSGGPPFTRYE